MARDFELWSRIRADFLATGIAYPQLAKKYGVSLNTLKKVAAREKWTAKREAVDTEALAAPTPARHRCGTDTELTDAEVIDLKRDRFERFMEITDAMMDRISDALTSPEVISPYSLKLLASALRDLREMQGLNKSALDIEEQQARIEKLRSETRTVDASGEGGIIYMPVMAERPEPPEDDDA